MLIATDLDGTLVAREAERPSTRTAAALRLADDAGVPVVFVTARALRHLDGFWPYVGRHGRAIASNGAVTYDVHTSSVIHHIGLEPGRGLEIMSAITRHVPDATFAIECLDGIRIGTGYHEPHWFPADTPRGDLRELWHAVALKLLVRSRDPAPD